MCGALQILKARQIHVFLSVARLEQFRRRSNIRGAREEMERALSARVANSEFYGVGDDKIEEIKKEQEVLLEAIRRPRIALDSAAFVWMVKENNG